MNSDPLERLIPTDTMNSLQNQNSITVRSNRQKSADRSAKVQSTSSDTHINYTENSSHNTAAQNRSILNESEQSMLRISSLITSIANFSVQYNFSAISIALVVMSVSVCTETDVIDCQHGNQASWVSSTATATVFAGAIAGQLLMGYAGDIWGRNVAMTATLAISAVSAAGSAIFPTGSAVTVYAVIIGCRFILGIGLGGIFPLSATKAAEDAGASCTDDSGERVDTTSAAKSFFWQAPGAIAPWLVAFLLTYTEAGPNAKWRLILGLGAVPSGVAAAYSVYERSLQRRMEKSHDSKFVANTEASDFSNRESAPLLTEPPVALSPVAPNVLDILRTDDNVRKLLVTGGSWFLYDLCYYGVALFGAQILDEIHSSSSAGAISDDNVTSDANVRRTTTQEMLALSMAVPGTLLSIYLMAYCSTKSLQIGGFLAISACFVLLAATLAPLRDAHPQWLLAVYCLLLFALCVGPNTTTYVLPAESYPKRIRATLNGMSAALGKLGAVVGAYTFGYLKSVTSLYFVLCFSAAIAALGAVMTYWALPSRGFLFVTGVGSNDCTDRMRPSGTARL